MITIKDVTLRRGTKLVLDAASVTIQPGENVGLVGRNGAGKSSLFALLTNRLGNDGGDVYMPPRWRVGEVAQNMPETDDGATDYVLEGDTRLMEAQALLAAAEASDDGHAIADGHQALADAGAFDARPRAQALLMGLGFKGDQLDAPVNSFSGGWRMRLQLARALMCPADLLLLDEPTNHLDLDALVWLEAWLKRFEGTMLVISHDREFLDAITGVTVHLDDAKLTRYGGNYTAFEEMRAERMVLQQASFEKQKEKMAHLQKFIDRFKAKASKAKQAQSRVKALDRMERLAPVLTSREFSFEFREPLNLPNPMLSLKDVECGYASLVDGEADKIIVRNISRSVLAGQRIGILGANGQGKSTVVKTIARDQKALGGTITEGKGLAIGYFAQQELDVLRPDESPLNHMTRLARDVGPAGREQELRNFLGQFRFAADMVNQAVGTLSGGEKARLVLAMLVWQRPNLLLLDEPTNHLDLDTREALSMALNEFEGSLMLVSHDRALLREVCDEFWLVADGGVRPFDGDLDDYQKYLLDTARAQAKAQRDVASASRKTTATSAAASGSASTSAMVTAAQAPSAASPVKPVKTASAPAAPAAVPARRDDRKADAAARQQQSDKLKPLRKEINRIDNRLGVLFNDRDAIEAALATGQMPPAQLADKGRQLKAISEEIGLLESQWLELSTQVDELSAQAG
jgi:ATP-binding cassette subfamily F protein 3